MDSARQLHRAVLIPGDGIKAAYNRTLADGQKTRDLGGTLGTEAFADAVIARLES
jgi:isocitrate/isopropylmalate dehydrogenase